jgi:tetratricopeptide (TPR) repeat protein
LRNGQARTALQLLNNLKDRIATSASQRVRYRLLSNIGAAHYNLGEYGAASGFLLEAAPLNPDDHLSLANKTAALLVRGRKEEAHEVAVAATAMHPDSQEMALQRMQALGPNETVEDVWCLLPKKAKSAAQIFAFRVSALREAQDDRWWSLTIEGCSAYPADEGLKVLRAEGIIERLLKFDPGAVGLAKGDGPKQAELTEAAEQLEKIWNESKGKEVPAKLPCAHNSALAWNILGETTHAAALLDEALAAGLDSNEAKHLRLSIYRRQGKAEEAIKLSDTLSDTPVHRVMRADLRSDLAPAEARSILADRASFTAQSEIIAAASTIIDTFIGENDYCSALAEADRLEAALPDHPQGPLAHFHVKKMRGDEDGSIDLDRSLALITKETDFPTRFLVANALASVDRFNDVVTLLAEETSCNFDSPALRLLVSAAVNADKRALSRKILKSLPDEVACGRFYLKSQIALSIRAGNISAAEEQIRAFLENEPNNLELHIQLIQALFRQGKTEELEQLVALPASKFNGQPDDFLKLAHFKGSCGRWPEAHKLAYATLLAHSGSQAVAMGYIGIFLGSAHSQGLKVEALAVENDMAVGLKNDDGSTSLYIIEPEVPLRPSGQYIAPDHLLAKRLAGKSVGDDIELPDRTLAKIVSIKPKVLHALHDLLDNFNNRHPDARGLERVRVTPDTEGGLEPILKRVRDRHDAIEQIGKLYASGAMPLAIVGRSLGCDPIEAMVGLASTGHAIRSCDGNQMERANAFAAIKANAAKGCVVDAATLHVMRRLKLEPAIVAVCGPIRIVDETALLVQRKIHELKERLDEPDMSISWREGQLFRQETTPEQKQAALKVLEDDQRWLAKNAAIIPAEGSKDPGPEWQPIIESFGSHFLDEVRAAEGAGLLLLAEDQILRGVAEITFNVRGTWLQPVLMRAREQMVITLDEYRKAVVGLIECKFEFVSVGADLLVSAVRGTKGHALPRDFEILASRIGGKKADGSHLQIAYSAAVKIWDDITLPDTVRQGVVGRLLERLIDDRTRAEVMAVIATWAEAERRRAGDMIPYIAGWLKGHFIKLEN